MSSSDKSPSIEDEYPSGPAKGLTPNVLLLGFISFLGDIASEMLYPIMPLFISTYLGVPAVGLGAIEGLAEATASLLKVFSGKWTDRSQKRKPWILSGYILSAFARPVMGMATGWGLVTTGRLLDRVGKGLRTTPRDALLADSVSASYRGKAFGWHRGMDTFGATVGPLLTLYLLHRLDGNLRWLYFVAFIPGLLSALTVFWIRETPFVAAPESTQWRIKELPRPFWNLIAVLIFFSLTNSSDLFVFLKFQTIDPSMTTMILAYCGFNLVYALLSPVLGTLSDRHGKGKIFQIGLFVFSLVYATFALSQNWIAMAAGFVLYGVYMAATEGISKALAIDLVPPHLKGTALGVVGLSIGFSTLIANTTAGLLWDQVSPQAPFWLGTIGALLSFVLFQILMPKPALQ